MLYKRTTLLLISKKAQNGSCTLGLFLTAFLFFFFRSSERLREQKRRHTREKMEEKVITSRATANQQACGYVEEFRL